MSRDVSASLGIYKDANGSADTVRCPAYRGSAKCINCNLPWDLHWNWACDVPDNFNGGKNTAYDEVPPERRYLTQEMANSVANLAKLPPLPLSLDSILLPVWTSEGRKRPGPDLSDWRTWAKTGPGECPCGVARSTCEYHR